MLTAEYTLKFHKPQMAEYPYWTYLVAERPPSNFERSLQPTSRSDGYSDTFQRLIRGATRTTAANQVESEKIALYSSLSLEIDYKSLMAEHTLRFVRTTYVRTYVHMSGFFYFVR